MEPVGYHSFLVRLWRETSADGIEQWCGEVEHIQSGTTQRFTSIDALLAFLRPPTEAVAARSSASPVTPLPQRSAKASANE